MDHKQNEKIIQEQFTSILDKIQNYKTKWMQHVSRADDQRCPERTLQYQPRRKRNLGRPLKRLSDDIQLDTQTTKV